MIFIIFFSSRRRHTRWTGDWSSDVCSSDLAYRSGALLDMARVTRLAHDAGALVLWDVSHSAGSVRVPLESSGADLAEIGRASWRERVSTSVVDLLLKKI